MTLHDPQVKLGNLHDISQPELTQLLNRQRALLANKVFIQRLPDKGAKIQNFIARIEHVIAEKSKVDETAELFQNLALQADQSERHRSQDGGHGDAGDGMLQEGDKLRDLVNRQHEGKVIIDNSQDITGHKYVNTYERVLRRVENTSQGKQADKFMPYRSVKHKELDKELVEQLKEPQNIKVTRGKGQVKNTLQTVHEDQMDDSQPKETSIESLNQKEHPKDCENSEPMSLETGQGTVPSSGRLKFRYDECLLENRVHTTRTAKVVSVEESIHLMHEQKRKHEELQAIQAAQRLAGQLRIPAPSRPETFNPESGLATLYRTAKPDDSDVDSDDNPDDTDYPE